MLAYKAIRHLVLDQAARAKRLLERQGHPARAEEVATTANRLVFEPGAEAPDVGTEADDAIGGRAILVHLPREGAEPLTRRVPAAAFKLYGRKADDLVVTARDEVQEANAAAARAIFRELHQARLGHPLDPATETVLAGGIPEAAVTPQSVVTRVRAALAGLTAGAFLLALWQVTRTFNFIDFTYLLENLHRLERGEVPYRDFFLVLPPLHYWLHLPAFLLGDGSAWAVACSGALLGAASVPATYWACQAVHSAPRQNLLFAAIPAGTGVAMVGIPSYDSDAVLAATLAIGALLRAEAADGWRGWALGATAGVATAAAALIKINIGVPLALGIVLALAAGRVLFMRYPWPAALGWGAGMVTALGAVALWLHAHDALAPFVQQTLEFPARTRLQLLPRILESLPLPRRYGSVHFLTWAAVLLLLWGQLVLGWFAGSHRRPVAMLLAGVVLAVCLGTMQSQGFGSVYGLGAMASLTLAMASRSARSLFGRRGQWAVAALGAAVLLTALDVDVRRTRLRFLKEQLTDLKPFRQERLRGLRGHAPMVDALEAAAAWTARTVRPGEEVFWWPGTAPYYLVTDRRAPLRNVQVFGETGLESAQAVAQLRARRVRWVLAERRSVLMPIDRQLEAHYAPVDSFGVVTVYRLRERP